VREPHADLDDLIRWRDRFPILATSVYMISNSLGAMPRDTAEALAEYAHVWATRGVRAWEEVWWDMPRAIGDRVARIIGAPAGSVSMHENVTTAQAIVLSCFLPTGSRRRIVCQEADFPSLLYLYRGQQRAGFELTIVGADPDHTVPLDRLLHAIDERTRLVCISHVTFKNSYIVDIAAVIERAHAVGALVVLDVYQSAGIVPLDVTALEADFAVGGCLKWLCGGPGTGFLYTRPDLLPSLDPAVTGWLANRRPFEFKLTEHELHGDARRMMNGTPSIPAYYAARAGLDIVAEVGVARIRAKSMRMTARLLELADAHGFSSIAPRNPDRLGGTVAIGVQDAKHVARALKGHHFIADYRPGAGIRVSPHFYNTFEEIERIMAEVARIVQSRDYDVDAPFRSPVT